MPPRRHITARMIAANRANARRSTGPRTAAGKARSRRNGLVHGLRAATLAPPLLADAAERARYDALVDALRAEFRPAWPLEELLIRSLAEACFGLRRALLAEAAGMVAAAAGGDPSRLVSTMMAVLRYQAPHKRRFTQSLRALTRIHALRRRLAADQPAQEQPVAPPRSERAHDQSTQPVRRPFPRRPSRPCRAPLGVASLTRENLPSEPNLHPSLRSPPPGPRLPLAPMER